MKRRQFMRGATTAAGAVAASNFPAPAISHGLMKWRMQTTWPKNFPGLGTGANKLADYIGTASGGKLTVAVYGGGEIVPAFETMDAVSNGTIEMGLGPPYYWVGQVSASQFLPPTHPQAALGERLDKYV